MVFVHYSLGQPQSTLSTGHSVSPSVYNMLRLSAALLHDGGPLSSLSILQWTLPCSVKIIDGIAFGEFSQVNQKHKNIFFVLSG